MANNDVNPALRRRGAAARPIADTFAPANDARTDRPATQKTSLQLEVELYRRIKVLAAQEDTKPGDLVNAAMRDYLDRKDSTG